MHPHLKQWDTLIYIAHPYTAYPDDPEWDSIEGNVEKYLKIVAKAMEDGYVVLSWIYNHLTTAMGLTKGKDAKFYLDQDKRLIDCCDELWVAGPHEISSGMQEEIAHAMRIEKPVRYTYKEKQNMNKCPWCRERPKLYWLSRHKHILTETGHTYKARFVAKCSNQNCHCAPEVHSDSLRETMRRWNSWNDNNGTEGD